jgi:hypothetical protein
MTFLRLNRHTMQVERIVGWEVFFIDETGFILMFIFL